MESFFCLLLSLHEQFHDLHRNNIKVLQTQHFFERCNKDLGTTSCFEFI